MIREVPMPVPVTTPVDEPTVAFVISLLDHVPPETVWVRLVVDPTHVVSVPVIGPGVVTTFTVAVTAQPPTR